VSDPIVFAGDSITDGQRRLDPTGIGGGYVDFVTTALRERGVDVAVHNAGVSGDRVEHLAPRWRGDVLVHRPGLLSVYIGVNDTLAAFFLGRATPDAVFQAHYARLLDEARAAGVRTLVLVEPFYVGTDVESVPWYRGNAFIDEDLTGKRAAVRDLAAAYDAVFVPLHDQALALASVRGPRTVAPDGVHPSATGTAMIARAWLRAVESAGVQW
jgi:lysophospholipase L1-like esterase